MDSEILGSGYLLEILMNNMPDAIYFKDRQSRFVKVNQACADKHGWESVDAVMGHSDYDVFSKVHADQAFADEQRIIETGEPLFGIEEKETWPDGSVTWASTTKMPLKSADGKIIGTFGISRDITKHKEAELHAQQAAEEMRLITEEMEEDFRMAGDLQKTFFPSGYPAFPRQAAPEECCVEFLHDFKACSDVGGDYCAIHRVSETEAGIFLCDVKGIGVRSALGTALIRGIVQEINPLGLEPGAYLSRMNELLIPLVCHEEVWLGVTACYLLLDAASGKIRFASAGHPLPVFFRQETGAEWLCAGQEPCGPALASQSGLTYSAVECHAKPGDAVVLYTDGLCNVENTLGDAYGATRLLDAAQSLTGDPLADIFQGMEGDARAFARNGAFTDDVCLVGFQLRKLL
jgi:sigma-B regulation protein RsbU (phosphoserine phosphatase)